jgi:hypothetical protein
VVLSRTCPSGHGFAIFEIMCRFYYT